MASVVLHLVVAGAIVGRDSDRSRSLARLSRDDEANRKVKLGLEQSRSVSITWIGFEEPTEHDAPESEVEQAALAPPDQGAPPPGPESPILGPVQGDAESAEQAAPAPSEVAPTPEAPDVVRELVGPPAPSTVTPSPEVRAPRETPEPATEQANETAPTQATPGGGRDGLPTPRPGPVQPVPRRSLPGLPSTKEAIASALKNAIDAKPGKPLAGQGLEIKTTHPKFTTTTLLTALPRNPVMQVSFDTKGKVAHADFLPGQGTGWAHVDGPLQNAVYQWTAKGEALKELTRDEPYMTITLRILLR